MADTVQAAKAELARVLDVNPKEYTCALVTENSNKPMTNVPYSSPYCHYPEGEGMTFVPEVGSQAILLHTNEGPIIIGFIMTAGTDRFRGNRPVAKPGDIFASTRDGNFLYLHRGGVVQIGATPAAQRMYIPLDRLIRDICQNYHLDTFGGSLHWEVEQLDQEDPAACLTLRGYELASDEDASVTLKIGKAYEADDARKGMGYTTPSAMQLSPGVGYIELEISKEQGDRTFLLRVDRGGNEFMSSSGGYEREYRGKCFLRMGSDFSHTVLGGMSLGVGKAAPAVVEGSLNEDVKVDANRTAGGTMKDKCLRRVVDADTIQLGSTSASQPAVLGRELTFWLMTHTHLPATGPLPLNPADGARLVKLLSSTVFLE